MENLRRLALRLGVRASFLGFLGEEALADLYCSADVFVMPTDNEGFPTVIAEAMDFGLPIVATGIRGIADHLTDGVNALFIPPGDVDALASAISRLARDEQLREAMSAANTAAVSKFEPRRVALQYSGVIAQMMEAAEASRTVAKVP